MGTGWGSGQPQEGGSAHSGPSPHTRLSRQRVSVLTCPLFWTASFFLNIYLFVCAESYLQPVGSLIFVASCDPFQSTFLGNSMDRAGHKRVGHDLSAAEHTHRHMGSLVVTCGIEFPDQGLNPGPPSLGARSFSHRAAREVPGPFHPAVCVLLMGSQAASFS